MSRDVTQIPKPHTFRSEKYKEFVREHPCFGCGKSAPSEAHHVRLHDGGWGMKPADTQTIPLCLICHDREENGRSVVDPISVIIKMVRLQTEYIGKMEKGE